MKEKRIVKLVADSAAFIRNAQLQDIAEVVFTIKDVVNEIRDAATKQRLRVLPYEIQMIEPSAESILAVTEFSKKTGDYSTLSATDIKVLALTYQLEVEVNGKEHLKTEPTVKKTVVVGPKPPGSETSEKIAGFYVPRVNSREVDKIANQLEETSLKNVELQNNEAPTYSPQDVGEGSNNIEQHLVDVENDDQYSDIESSEEEQEVTEHDDDTDDDEGWITPNNLEHVKKSMGGVLESVQLDVACLTTDFAMQNVLMQIGLNVVSLEGRLIHEARTYILRCYACFKTTTNITKVFCPKCGNQTLKKVAVSLNEDGTMQIHISSRKKLTARGKKFSLPMPKGGKHACNPILCEDQREAQQRASRLGRTKTNALDPDYIAGNSPFAVNDVYSRAAMLGRTGKTSKTYWNRRNPTEFRKKR